MLKVLKVVGVAALLAAPVAVHAQGIFGGMERGAAEGPLAQLVVLSAALWVARSAA
jgi:hypothetical protein